MNARELVEHISQNDQRLAILHALCERPGTPSDLADRVGADRTPVYTALEDLEQCGGVVSLDGRRKLTAAGHIPVEETVAACEAVGREAIAYLAASTGNKRLRVLDGFANAVGRTEMLRDAAFPTRSTIKRAIEDFESFGWTSAGPTHELTATGRDVHDTYAELIRVVGIVVEKLPYLRHVDPRTVEIPVDVIADAEMVQGLPNRPYRPTERTRERLRGGFDHARIMSSFYSEAGVREVYEAITDGATIEALSPLPAHIPLPTSVAEIRHFRMGLGTDAVSWQVYPDDLPLDLVVFDDERVLLGPSVELEGTRKSAIIDSTDPELIAWATDLYESYKADASAPLEYLLDPIREAGIYKALRLDWVRDYWADRGSSDSG